MGSFAENLKKFFYAPAITAGQSGFIKFTIKCNRCGEEIPVKVRTTSELSRVYEEDQGPPGAAFIVRKEILGNKCNNLIYLNAYFDENFKSLSSDLTGGKIIE